MKTEFLKKPLATLAIIGAVGVTAGITSIASAAVGGASANAPVATGEMRRRPGVVGVVSSVNGTTILVAGKDGVNYTVDASAATFHKGGAPGSAPSTVTIADIAVGDTVGIRGTLNGTSVVASEVMDGIPPMMGMGHWKDDHGVRGTVSAINGTTLTITNTDGTSYTVDASSATVSKVSTITLGDIKVGDTIGAEGTLSGTSVKADHIMTGDFPKGPRGTVPADDQQ